MIDCVYVACILCVTRSSHVTRTGKCHMCDKQSQNKRSYSGNCDLDTAQPVSCKRSKLEGSDCLPWQQYMLFGTVCDMLMQASPSSFHPHAGSMWQADIVFA